MVLSSGLQITGPFLLQSGETALHVAARYGHADVVQLLCSFGSNPDFQDKVGPFLAPSLDAEQAGDPGDAWSPLDFKVASITEHGSSDSTLQPAPCVTSSFTCSNPQDSLLSVISILAL